MSGNPLHILRHRHVERHRPRAGSRGLHTSQLPLVVEKRAAGITQLDSPPLNLGLDHRHPSQRIGQIMHPPLHHRVGHERTRELVTAPTRNSCPLLRLQMRGC